MIENFSMNFLAHAYLSFDQKEILIGNFIGDFVKGKNLYTYPTDIRNGILLHREIDRYTDLHPLVKEGQSYLRPYFGHYANVITDIYFDYFLGFHWEKFSRLPLETFAHQTYQSILSRQETLPEKFVEMFFWMQSQNWLLNYRTRVGIEQTFRGLSRRARFDSKMEEAPMFLAEKENEFREIFFAFFKDLETFAIEKLLEIKETNASHKT